MAKKLHVTLQDEEYEEIKRAARSRNIPVADWIRHALADAVRREPSDDVAEKLENIRAAAKHEFPTSDIETMLAEIEKGYL